MARRWRGVLAIEGEQTGDGRVIADGAITWADLPLPLGWLQEEQHGDLLSGAVQVGTIDSITRADGGRIEATGSIDDEQPDGAELVRRLDGGTASLGSRVGLSIDPDDWEYEVIATDAEEAGIVIIASAGRGPLPHLLQPVAVTAAAGDPDPGPEGGDAGTVLWEDASDTMLQRFTRLRIRGVTACAIAAFDGAYLELEAADSAAAAEEPAAEAAPAVAASARASRPAPPAAVFAIPEPEPGWRGMLDVYGMPAEELLIAQPDGGLGVPLTIADDGRVFGHAARWGQCHVGYPGQCITAPPSMAAYAHFHVGSVVCADGSRVSTGVLTVGCDHALAELRAPEARDHYAHSGLGWANVRATNGAFGVWVSGALRPDVTDEQVALLRSLSLSGDWRRIGADLEFIAALAVNVPGFPVARDAVVASGLRMVPALAASARAYYDGGEQLSLVASGVVHRCPECQQRAQLDSLRSTWQQSTERALGDLTRLSRLIELRTRHLVPAAAEAAMARIRG